ncbi:MAG: SH3 domain-containing protein, partial [Anaerolineales bacterium]|nr:SH3 domain-containing protein [Anaerolineales bacterium]
TNVGAVVDQASLAAFLNDPTAQSNQVNAVVNTAVSGGYAGVNLDYQNVAASQADAFTGFVVMLSDALHAQNLSLALTLGTPQETGGNWDSGGQNWEALGPAADVVYVQMPFDPTAYGQGGTADLLLAWATRQIDRSKLVMMADAGAVDRIGESYTPMSNEDALANFGTLEFVQGGEEIAPDTNIEVVLSGNATPLEWDGTSLTYTYSYEANGQTHNVWLGNPAALSQRLSFATAYHLHGIAVRGLGDVAEGAGYATALSSAVGAGAPPETTGAAIVWTVQDENGSVLASESGSELAFSWANTAVGNYTVNADFAIGDNVAPLGSLSFAVVDPSVETAEAEPEATPEGTSIDIDTSSAAVAEEPASFDPGNADAVINTNANVRVGPGLGYGLVAGGAAAGTQVQLLGRNADSSWLQILLPSSEKGWVFSTLVTVNSNVDVASLEIVEVEAPAASDSGSGTTPAPAPVPAPPVSNAGFELGGQAFGAPYGMMSYAGMTWIKRQHKWSPGQSGSDVAGVITEAHNAGFKILLSIPGVNLYPSSIDFAAYTEFLRQVAALPDPPNAIEIWNEQNIDREWPVGSISPSAYVTDMLAPAYNAIKGANGSVMVVSGAPAPTGFFGGCSGNGCDDANYMAAMAAAGAANYMDCIGIHYNEGILSPNQTSGDPRTEHYTRYFWGMVDAYYNAFGGSRKLCFTELGYLTPEGYGSLPGGFSWASNVTVAQQAQWLAEAASLSAGSGKVRMMIVWNVDSTTWGDDPQAGYAIIRSGGSCPACESLRQVMGGG